ncbi:MAG: hypothetical protein LBM69_09675 [Lachnospiraceae bacterium]|nr:hypothetical protein [Lachnospiraceae bacterium]
MKKRSLAHDLMCYLIYLVPVGILITILVFFNQLFHHFDRTYYDAVYEQQVLKLNSIVGEIRKLRELGFTDEENSEIFVNVLSMAITKIDSEEGIFARIMDMDFQYLSEVIVAEKERGPVTLFDQDSTHPDFDRISRLMRTHQSGEASFVDAGYPMRLYYIKIPQDQPKYYLVVGVDAAHVLSNFKSFPFEIGIFVISMLIMSMLYYILYLRFRLQGVLRDSNRVDPSLSMSQHTEDV